MLSKEESLRDALAAPAVHQSIASRRVTQSEIGDLPAHTSKSLWGLVCGLFYLVLTVFPRRRDLKSATSLGAKKVSRPV
jgi:hypothetical protein